MLIKRPDDIKPSEITDKRLFLNRRQFLVAGAAVAVGAVVGKEALEAAPGRKLPDVQANPGYGVGLKATPYTHVTTYNNFYEFSTDKSGPASLAKNFKTEPWTITVEGEAAKTGVFQLEGFLAPHQLEERLYRFRCVEGWSMVVPWVGVPLQSILKRFQPTSKAKFVEFTTLYDPEQMPGQRRAVLEWPYVEGLRIDEAMHPLTMMVVGLYGEELPNQNGAPLRLIVPWKYGFKNIKSIVKIRFTERQPVGTWEKAAPNEYGFYANVNPKVDHPRWSQAKERPLGAFLKQDTLMFNGYADQVAQLYAGMDLRKYF